MNDQKIEDLLNLALDATAQEREKSTDLTVGYDPTMGTWELIVKYGGDLAPIRAMGIPVVEMLNNYAIITVPENMIDFVADLPEIEFIEKPKRLFFATNQGRSASCINAVQTAQYNLFGEGILMAIIDSGIDYEHPDFCNSDGTTRILELWDQTIDSGRTPAIEIGGEIVQPGPPPGYYNGSVYTRDMINVALSQPPGSRRQIVPSIDLSGHGTNVAGIAAGNGRASSRTNRGIATKSDLLIVKLGTPRDEGFPRTTELMEAINYAVEKGMDYEMPVVINISFGNNYGAHDGTSLLETFIDDMAGMWKTTIVIGTGNEGAASGHTSAQLVERSNQDIQLAVSSYELSLNVQIWKDFVDDFDIEIVGPGGTSVGPLQHRLGPQRFILENTELLLYYGEPSPFSRSQEIYIEFLPNQQYVTQGIWTIRLIPSRIIDGRVDLWLPGASVVNEGTRFLYPNPELTLTVPSTAHKAISVGAYNSMTDSFAIFSGRGLQGHLKDLKPDLAAPGVSIMTTAVGGGYTAATGTSFATPFVSGSAALLMEWGINQGNDPYLYGEKLKAYLLAGASRISGILDYPNDLVGYGALCLRNTFLRIT